jgi:ABC-type multidrug transport system fused ATPase/permease subunit
LTWALFDTFKFEFLLGGALQLTSSIFQVVTPFASRFLIAFATEAYIARGAGTEPPPVGRGIGLAIGLFLMQVMQCLCAAHFIYRGMIVGGQVRAALIQVIFVKATKLSGRAKAGGRLIESDDAAALTAAKNQLLSNKKSGQKTGAKVTADIASGVAGDGSGWGNGKIITLMSVDTDRIDKSLGLFHVLWTAPITVIITLILLLINITYSALSGYALLVLGMPLLTYSIRILVVRRRKINKLTDQRVSLTQEILQAVRFVKFFGWESSFLERLKDLRRQEIFAIQIVMSIRNAILSVSMALPVFASMLSFITYSLTKHTLTPAPIFSSLALFNALRMPLNLFPMVLGQVVDAYTGICRIQEFLLAEEQADDIKFDESLENAVEMDHASFTWERLPSEAHDDEGVRGKERKRKKKVAGDMPQQLPEISDDSSAGSGTLTPSIPFQLNDLTFSVGRNELLAVIGTVGSGKSSLLSALAGDMRRTGGSLTLGGSRAFCPQYAWIQNANVKENILFGKEYDETWYNQVIDACALRPDLAMLAAGDRTEIGERGITVSGGQKQRLNIARAIYFNADIVLMDDPLSAVDAHVGRHIMDSAICGLLKDKCRILATHQLHVLSRCDRIILMNEGHIEAIDTFDNLMRDSQVFQRLMALTSQEEEEEATKELGGEEDDVEETEPKEKPRRSKKAVALMQVEERAVNSVSWAVWRAYISGFGLPIHMPLIVLTLVLANAAAILTNLWLSYWIMDKFGLSRGGYMGIYAALGFAQVILMFAFSTHLSTCGTNASKVMLQRAMTRVLRAPLSFFDTTPLGRITNRFSSDIHTMDNDLTDAMRIYALTFTMIVSVLIMIMVFYPFVGSFQIFSFASLLG